MGSLEKHIIISSEDKDKSSSNSNSDFVVNLQERYYTQNILKVLVSELTVPNVFPNIRGPDYGSSQNNRITYDDGTGEKTGILPEGQYLIGSSNPLLDFTTQLTNVINATTAATVQVTYNELTNKFEFACSTPFSFYPNGLTTGSLGPITFPSTMADALGITEELFVPGGLVPTPAQSQADLSGFQNVYVHSKEIALSHAIDGDTGLISVVSPVSLADTPFGGYAYRQNNDDELASIVYDQVRNLSRISIVLRDNLGNKLPIGGHKMNIVLKCYLDSG